MRQGTTRALALLWGLALLVAVPPVQGSTARDGDAARDYFTDVELIDQSGETLRLYSDLMQDKVVLIHVIFTSCEGVCPVTMGNLVKIQKWLGPRLGEDVRILSLTVDREIDTPEKLGEYADKFGTRPGWHFLTGTPDNLDFALKKLGLWVRDREAHSTTFLIGNVPTGLWKKAMGMAPVTELITIFDSVLDDRLEIDETPAENEETSSL